MATSIAPAFIDALVSRATTLLPNVRVYDGFGISDDPSDFLMVGVDDPDPTSRGLSASAEQEQIGMGTAAALFREAPTLTCAAYSFNGNANQKTSRDAVFAIRDAIDGELRSNRVTGPTPSVLGVAGVTSAGVVSWALTTDTWQTADALLVFTVRFEAII